MAASGTIFERALVKGEPNGVVAGGDSQQRCITPSSRQHTVQRPTLEEWQRLCPLPSLCVFSCCTGLRNPSRLSLNVPARAVCIACESSCSCRGIMGSQDDHDFPSHNRLDYWIALC